MNKTSSHLDYIDFVKGVAALSVVLLHTLPVSILKGTIAVYHIWQAVPVFIFISFYLCFRNLERKDDVFKGYYSVDRIKKLFTKIWMPLLILAGIEAVFFFAIGDNSRAVGSLLCYDNGPGSYYVWCYMQIWFLMPVIYLLLKRYSIVAGGGYLLIISLLLDFLWEKYCGIKPGYTCFRYLFLSVPAFMLLKNIEMKKIIPLALMSILYLALMLYSNVPVYMDPVLPNGWEAQTSLGFFYTLLLVVLLSKLYEKLKPSRIREYISHLGTISWEVFLVQMVLIGSGVLSYTSSKLFNSTILQIGFKVIAALVITVLFAELYKRLLDKLVHAKP